MPNRKEEVCHWKGGARWWGEDVLGRIKNTADRIRRELYRKGRE